MLLQMHISVYLVCMYRCLHISVYLLHVYVRQKISLWTTAVSVANDCSLVRAVACSVCCRVERCVYVCVCASSRYVLYTAITFSLPRPRATRLPILDTRTPPVTRPRYTYSSPGLSRARSYHCYFINKQIY